MGAKNPTVSELLEALRTHRVSARMLSDEEERVKIYGIQHDDHIVVNEAQNLADTIIHEVLHAIRPGWSEQTISRRASVLAHRLSDADIQALYRLYIRRRQRRRKIIL